MLLISAACPNMVVMAAADEAELVHMVATAAAYDDGPIAFRYPRGEGVGVDLPEPGHSAADRKGPRAATGRPGRTFVPWHPSGEALTAAEELRSRDFQPLSPMRASPNPSTRS